ncbi:MAG: GTPase domain-containing protein [Planctomycetes bacterium]|nr:GTPase domain-containing protein [Planctomycetota bacterium]
MVQINFAQKTVNAKVVYYGPGMSGKTTNLEVVHQKAPNENRGNLTSISTDGDRTLFFDYMPLDLGTVAGMRTCFQLYTVPGQVYYNSTRKLVLQGVDGVIFVADSSPGSMEGNLESLRNLEENLNEYGKSLATTAFVIQYNKRDIPGALSVAELDAALNPHKVPTFEAVAATGQGVFPTLKALASVVLKNLMAEAAQSQQVSAALPAQRALPVAAAAPVPVGAAAAQPPMRATVVPPPGNPTPNTVAPVAPAYPAASPTAAGRPGLGQTNFHQRPGTKPGGFSPGVAPAARPAPVPQPSRPRAAAPAVKAPVKSGNGRMVTIVGAALVLGAGAIFALLKFL